jgi:hypothetical protein
MYTPEMSSRGENAGRRLEPMNVVHASRFLPAAAEGQTELAVLAGIGPGSVVVFLQEERALEVLAVSRTTF